MKRQYYVKENPKDRYFHENAYDLKINIETLCKSSQSYVKPVNKIDNKIDNKKGVVTKQPVNTQTFATQNTELTKQIQTSLGNTAPTGQITDTDLDLILTQLKQV